MSLPKASSQSLKSDHDQFRSSLMKKGTISSSDVMFVIIHMKNDSTCICNKCVAYNKYVERTKKISYHDEGEYVYWKDVYKGDTGRIFPTKRFSLAKHYWKDMYAMYSLRAGLYFLVSIGVIPVLSRELRDLLSARLLNAQASPLSRHTIPVVKHITYKDLYGERIAETFPSKTFTGSKCMEEYAVYACMAARAFLNLYNTKIILW